MVQLRPRARLSEAFIQFQLHFIQRLLEMNSFSRLLGYIEVDMDVTLRSIILVQFSLNGLSVHLVGMDDVIPIRFKGVFVRKHQG